MIFVARGFLAAATAILLFAAVLFAAVLFAARLLTPAPHWFGCDWPLGDIGNLSAK